jgi:hypothetical protein
LAEGPLPVRGIGNQWPSREDCHHHIKTDEMTASGPILLKKSLLALGGVRCG